MKEQPSHRRFDLRFEEAANLTTFFCRVPLQTRCLIQLPNTTSGAESFGNRFSVNVGYYSLRVTMELKDEDALSLLVKALRRNSTTLGSRERSSQRFYPIRVASVVCITLAWKHDISKEPGYPASTASECGEMG